MYRNPLVLVPFYAQESRWTSTKKPSISSLFSHNPGFHFSWFSLCYFIKACKIHKCLISVLINKHKRISNSRVSIIYKIDPCALLWKKVYKYRMNNNIYSSCHVYIFFFRSRMSCIDLSQGSCHTWRHFIAIIWYTLRIPSNTPPLFQSQVPLPKDIVKSFVISPKSQNKLHL